MILAIDTSSAIAVAVVDGDRTVASRSAFAPRGHAELLAGLVKSALTEAGCERPTRIVVGIGPAPFTGLRVGLVTARTLGYAWGVPVDGVCSLDAMGAAHGGDVTVVADARRREVYWATYRAGKRVSGPEVSAPADVKVVGDVVGRGALAYPEAFPGAVYPGDTDHHAAAAAGIRADAGPVGIDPDPVGIDPDPAWLVRVADGERASGVVDFPTEPLYLRRPDVHGVPGA